MKSYLRENPLAQTGNLRLTGGRGTTHRWTKPLVVLLGSCINAKKHKRQRRKRQSVTAKREKSQTPSFITALQT